MPSSEKQGQLSPSWPGMKLRVPTRDGPFWHAASQSFSCVVCWGPKQVPRNTKLFNKLKVGFRLRHACRPSSQCKFSCSHQFLFNGSTFSHLLFIHFLTFCIGSTNNLSNTCNSHQTKNGTVLWKLLKSVELLQMWISFYGKEILPILHTRDLCFWNLCHNCGFVWFFFSFLTGNCTVLTFLFLSFGGFLHNRKVFYRGLLAFFSFYFSEEQLYFPRVNLDTEANVIPEIYFLFVCLFKDIHKFDQRW